MIKYKITGLNLLGLFSLISIGCSNSRTNIICQRLKGSSIGKKISTVKKGWEQFKANISNVIDQNHRTIVIYKIVNDHLEVKDSFNYKPNYSLDCTEWEAERANQEKHQKMWNCFTNIIGKEYRRIKHFAIFDIHTKKRPIDDARMTTIRYLKLHCLAMRFNLEETIHIASKNYLGFPAFVCTIIHEWFHDYTINEDQKHFLRNICNSIARQQLSGAGYYEPLPENESVLKQFKNTPSNKTVQGCSKNKSSEIQEKLFRKGAFVTRYAAKNHHEDAAETFVHFVLIERPEKGVKEAWDKVLLLYKNPRMVEIRESIRTNFKKLGICPNMSKEETEALLIKLQQPQAT